MSNLTFPVLHLNGSSPADLCSAYSEASLAISEAIQKLALSGPHMRDYPQGNFNQANEEHRARWQKLQEVSDELYKIAEHCSNFIK